MGPHFQERLWLPSWHASLALPCFSDKARRHIVSCSPLGPHGKNREQPLAKSQERTETLRPATLEELNPASTMYTNLEADTCAP